MSQDSPEPQSEKARLAAILGPDLMNFADVIPDAMAKELLRDDRGFIARYQLSEPLLTHISSDMRGWTTADVLRTLAPGSALARNRMQAIAGALAPIMCQAFPGFCYYPYIPFSHVAQRRSKAPLIIAVHGSSRNAKDLRDSYAAFAEGLGCFVLAPLFPLDLRADTPDEEYKHLIGDTVRYDRLLWAMVDELAAATATHFDTILLFGFSGGAQFAHRLFYADPARLSGLALGAPSYVTLPHCDQSWWTGIANFEELFGKAVDFDAMRRVPVQLIWGSEDDLDCDIYGAGEMGMDEAAYAAYGRNRPQRIERLARAWKHIGIETQQTIVEGAGHGFAPLLEASKPFFTSLLRNTRSS